MNPPPYIVPSNNATSQEMKEYESFPEYQQPKKKSKVIIPFPFYDIDITNFPKIKFIQNYRKRK